MIYTETDIIQDSSLRRQLGAFYTGKNDILKIIRNLFLNELYEKLNDNACDLEKLHEHISRLRFLDPACGCGNFLYIAYDELLKIENKIISITKGKPKVSEKQFYGIELYEQAAKKAKEHFSNIIIGNALTLEWPHADYIIGNPPFSGKKLMGNDRKEELIATGANANLDYVCGWFYKASDVICKNPEVEAAFVATSSIMQGEQATSLWKPLFEKGIEIKFGYKPFKWNNEAKKKAAVWVVIVGFSKKHFQSKHIYDGENYKNANNINQYLLDMENVFIEPRRNPLSDVSQMIYGSSPYDGGNLLLSQEEYDNIAQKYPEAMKYIRPYIGADEFLYGYKRYCLWLKEHDWNEFMRFHFIKERVMGVKRFRENSKRKKTKDGCNTPHLFSEIRQPENCNILVIPGVTSENRKYIPIGFINSNTIISGSCQMVPNATLYEFGIMTSSIHNVWLQYVSGRLESRISYSATISYNTFPWPDVTEEQKEKVARLAQKILDARALYPNMCLADMYGSDMPDDLKKAHKELDRYIMQLCGIDDDATSEEIFKILVQMYKHLTA